jgi:hypothetical protein
MKKLTKITKNNVTKSDWLDGVKPFDMMTCGECLSLHRPSLSECKDPGHQIVKHAVEKAGLLTPSAYALGGLQKHFSVFVKLRKRFTKFYPKVKNKD